jgi:hypothetical protein
MALPRITIPFAIIALFFIISFQPVSAARMPSGTPDPDFSVDIYKPEKVWPGTTLFPDYHNPDKARIVEVNMLGEVIWEYDVSTDLDRYSLAGEDVELLQNGNILVLFPAKGVYEINRNKEIIWKYLDSKINHDADRLPNGNTLIMHGYFDTTNDAQVIEINPQGQIVWSWYARDQFNKEPYTSIYDAGWTRANAVTRLPNGNTLVSLRSFNLTVEVNHQGAVVWQYDWSSIGAHPHEPVILPNGNILVCIPNPDQVIEMNRTTNEIVWKYVISKDQSNIGFARDADRLPNGNTLINDGRRLIEVTPVKEIVWQLTVKSLSEGKLDVQQINRALYKSERIGLRAPQFSIIYPQETGCTPKDIDISIQYDDTDLGSIWYRVFDRTKKTWATENITYIRNKWANAITFEGKETGQNKITLEEGDYTLNVWAASTGWGDENLYTPKVINTAESKVNFSVTANCAGIKPVSSTPVSSTTVSGTSSLGISTAQSTTAPLPWEIALFGIIVAGFTVKMRKDRTGKS